MYKMSTIYVTTARWTTVVWIEWLVMQFVNIFAALWLCKTLILLFPARSLYNANLRNLMRYNMRKLCCGIFLRNEVYKMRSGIMRNNSKRNFFLHSISLWQTPHSTFWQQQLIKTKQWFMKSCDISDEQEVYVFCRRSSDYISIFAY